MIFFMEEDSELWDIICDVPNITMEASKEGDTFQLIPKNQKNYSKAN